MPRDERHSNEMDSGLGSDEEQRRTRTKEQKQRLNEQLVNGGGGAAQHCFIDASLLQDDEVTTTSSSSPHCEMEQRRTEERRQGALLFQTGIHQYSTMLQLAGPSDDTPPDTPYNSIVHFNGSAEHGSVCMSDVSEGVEMDADAILEDENTNKPSLGFYVDLNDVEDENLQEQASNTLATKNIFSMVIDFEAPKKDRPSHLFQNTARRKSNGKAPKLSIAASQPAQPQQQIKTKSSESSPPKTKNEPAKNQSTQLVQTISSPETVQVHIECVDDDNSSEVEEAVSFITDASSETRIDITEKSPELQSDTKFVRLSDLMFQPARLDTDVCSDMAGPKMSRSIPESSWVESPLLMSRSAGFRVAPRPMEPDNTSLSDSTGSQTGPSQRRLGTDLLRMFLEEMDTDTLIHVGNRSIKAHRCILISRCQYFAGTLRGRSIELDGFSYDAVHFALCHIYSGASHVPDSISLVELASLADLLSLEGLKEVVSHALKARHCHNFHSPCAGCLTGVLEVLPLSSAYGLDDLYQKCLKWITTHYLRIWPSRAFASLQRELREKCLQQHVVHLSAATVLGITLSCDRLLASLPNLKWAEPVVQLALQLSQTCQSYVTQHFVAVLPTLMDAEPWNYPRIEEILLNSSVGLTLDQDCGVYSRCVHMLAKTKDSINLTLYEILVKLKEHIENRIVLKSHKLGKCQRWLRMEPELRAHIKSLAKMSDSLTKSSKTDLPSRLPRMITSKTATSSSESSRNSSPATSQSHTSPSLRRSLLLAARAPQVPPSPSSARRISTLTMPTAASAAKSAPPRHTKPTNPRSQPQSLTQPRPISAPSNLRKSASTKSANKEPIKKDPPRRPMNSANTLARKPTTPTPSKKATEISKSNETLGTKRKVATPTTTATQKVVQAETKSPQKSPGMQRSSTFLKDEPTVLNTLSSHGKI